MSTWLDCMGSPFCGVFVGTRLVAFLQCFLCGYVMPRVGTTIPTKCPHCGSGR